MTRAKEHQIWSRVQSGEMDLEEAYEALEKDQERAHREHVEKEQIEKAQYEQSNNCS